MQSFFEQLPKILESAGSSFYGVIAAIVVAIVVIPVFLIGPKATGRQERAFYVILLVLSAIVAVLFSLATGFSAGTEIATNEDLSSPNPINTPPASPLAVTLNSEAMKQLEDYMEGQGIKISPEAKTAVLSDAISSLEPPDTSINEAPDGTSLEGAFELKTIETTDSDYAWIGDGRLNELIPDRYHRLILKEDSELTITWDGKIDIDLLSSEGSEIQRFHLGKEGNIDIKASIYYIKTQIRYSGSTPRLDYEFRVFANTIRY